MPTIDINIAAPFGLLGQKKEAGDGGLNNLPKINQERQFIGGKR
jgi:hypothetical protein